METMLHVGHESNVTTPDQLAQAISKVLASIDENRVDREVALSALSILERAFKIENVNISNCRFSTESQPEFYADNSQY